MRNLTTEQNLKNKLEKPLIDWFIQIVHLSPVEKDKQTNKQTINDESLRDIKNQVNLFDVGVTRAAWQVNPILLNPLNQ